MKIQKSWLECLRSMVSASRNHMERSGRKGRIQQANLKTMTGLLEDEQARVAARSGEQPVQFRGDLWARHELVQQQPDRKPGKTVFEVFGHSASAVCRWFGAAGIHWSGAEKAMTALGVPLKINAIKTYVSAGAHKERGEPAQLTAEQAKQLKQLAGV